MRHCWCKIDPSPLFIGDRAASIVAAYSSIRPAARSPAKNLAAYLHSRDARI